MKPVAVFFEGSTARGRMLSFALIAVLGVLIIALLMLLQMDKLATINVELRQYAYVPNNRVKEMKYEVLYIRRTLRDANQEPDPALREGILQKLAAYDSEFFDNLTSLKVSFRGDPQPLRDVDSWYHQLLFYRNNVLDRLRAGHQKAVWDMTSDAYTGNPSTSLLASLDRLSTLISDNVTDMEKAANTLYRNVQWLLWGVLATVLSLVILSSIIFTRSITLPLRRLRDSIVALSGGRLDEVIPYQYLSNEIGEIAQGMTALQDVYRALNAKIWIESNTTQLSAECQGAKTFEELGQKLLQGIAPVLGIGQGLFFIVDESSKTLIRVAGYGHTGPYPSPSDQIIGTGLVEQCVINQKPLTIRPPEGYLPIRSGLGAAAPQIIYLQPVVMMDRVLGVVELATFQTFDENQQRLLDTLMPLVAMSLEIIGRNRRTHELLEESQRTKADLAMMEERSRLILSSVTDGIIGMDVDTKTIFVNATATSLLGYTSEDLLGQLIHPLVHYAHPDGREHILEQCPVFQTSRDGIPRKVERDVLWCKNGTPLPVEYTATPIYRAESVVGSVLVFRDLTERLRTEAAITAMEEHSRLILSSLREGIVCSDGDSRITFSNAAVTSLLGYTTEELLGRHMHDTLHYAYPDGSEFPREKCPMYHTLWDSQPRTVDTEVLWRRDGQPLPVEYVTTPVFKEGKVIGTVMVFRDITERKRAEDMIRDANEQQYAIFESATIGIAFVRDRIFQKCNHKLCELLMYDQEELIGQTTQCIYFDEDSHFALGRAHVDLERGQTHQRIQALRRKDGSRIWCRISGSAIAPGDLSRGTVWTVADVTHEREAVESLKHAKDMAEAATRMKSDFLANMSHEIRTPMNAILGLAQLTLRTELTHKQRDYQLKLSSSAQALLGILNDILDFSKIEAGRLTLEKTSFNLREVMDNLSNVTAIRAEEKGVELLFSQDQDVPERIIGDPLRLGQVLINLVGNAIKFTQTGEIVVAIQVAARQNNQVRLRFSVRDTGIGMTPEQVAHLFQSFHQVDSSITRRFGGTGLGLAISKQLIEMMNGRIQVDSAPQRGTTFTFDAEFAVGDNKTPRLLMPAEIAGKLVLVVDDNATSREILSAMLERLSLRVETAESGESALQKLEQRLATNAEVFDLVLMDWKMPGLNGIETIRRIQERTALSTIPSVIMVTAYGREEVMGEGGKADLDAFLVKPVGQSLLYDAILETFNHKSSARREICQYEMAHDRLASIRGARVLLVEDNSINQQVATEFLEQAGMVVDLAVNGQQGVAMASTGHYDLVLMDIQMPEMDGLEATRLIRARPALASLPIIAMTAHAMDKDRAKSLDAGMNGHLTKPIHVNHLFEILLRWIKPGERATPRCSAREAVTTSAGVTLPGHGPELDSSLGIQRVGGSPTLYVKLLGEFLVNHEDLSQRIHAALAEERFQEAEYLAHSVRGAAGTLGAGPLQNAASALETALREHPADATVPGLLQTFSVHLAALCQALRCHFDRTSPAPEPRPAAEVALAEVHALLRRLLVLLEAGDSEAEDVTAKLRIASRGTDWAKALGEIATAVDDVEFSTARTLTQALLVRMGQTT